MRPRNHLDGIQVAFDDHRLVDNAGLLLPATLALHLGLSQRQAKSKKAMGRRNDSEHLFSLSMA